jgi:hypothetical protein
MPLGRPDGRTRKYIKPRRHRIASRTFLRMRVEFMKPPFEVGDQGAVEEKRLCCLLK